MVNGWCCEFQPAAVIIEAWGIFFFFWFAAPWDRSFHLDAPRTPEKSPKLSSMAALNHNISVINSCNDDGNSIGRPVRRGDPRRPEETRGNPRRAEESDRVRRKIEVTGEEARGAEESRGEPRCLAESDGKSRWPEKRREEPRRAEESRGVWQSPTENGVYRRRGARSRGLVEATGGDPREPQHDGRRRLKTGGRSWETDRPSSWINLPNKKTGIEIFQAAHWNDMEMEVNFHISLRFRRETSTMDVCGIRWGALFYVSISRGRPLTFVTVTHTLLFPGINILIGH